MTTPTQRIQRLLDEGARFMVELPGQLSIDLTPDVIAALEEVQTSEAESPPQSQLTPVSVHGTDAER